VRLVGLHHVQISAPLGAEPIAREFYGSLVGMPEVPKPANLAKRGGVWFQVGPQQLHVGVENDQRPAHKAHPAFLVDGLDQLRRRLSDRGVETWEDEPLEGYRRFYARDPFGNRLEFLEPIAWIPGSEPSVRGGPDPS
jgi:catechol 2,3-dioxygenase-like lactoylglutathione lyase family enzyme